MKLDTATTLSALAAFTAASPGIVRAQDTEDKAIKDAKAKEILAKLNAKKPKAESPLSKKTNPEKDLSSSLPQKGDLLFPKFQREINPIKRKLDAALKELEKAKLAKDTDSIEKLVAVHNALDLEQTNIKLKYLIMMDLQDLMNIALNYYKDKKLLDLDLNDNKDARSLRKTFHAQYFGNSKLFTQVSALNASKIDFKKLGQIIASAVQKLKTDANLAKKLINPSKNARTDTPK